MCSSDLHSCNPGAMMRIVTGLRGVEDPELSELFRRAEGPNLARIFLRNTFNIYHEKPNLIPQYIEMLTSKDDLSEVSESAAGQEAISVDHADDAGDQLVAEGRVPEHESVALDPAAKRAFKLAQLLVDRGITLTSPVEAVSDVLTLFASESVEGYGVELDEHSAFRDEIRMCVMSVMDCYEDALLPYVRALVRVSDF